MMQSNEICALVKNAADPFCLKALGSKSSWGCEPDATALDLSPLTGVEYFYPAEMVVKVKAGTKLCDLNQVLDEGGHRLAFLPPELGPIWNKPAQSSIGGVVATATAGPRRAFRGGVRDHVLGVEFINGLGEAITSGGRVMKNVSGYDLCKLMAGSWGTLGPMTSITLKTIPKMELRRTLLVEGVDSRTAMALLIEASKSPFDPVSAAFIPAQQKAMIEIEGLEAAINYRTDALSDLLRPLLSSQELQTLDQQASADLWDAVGRVAPVLGEVSCLWRLKVKPSQAAELQAELERRFEDRAPKTLIDWGGNLIWLGSEAEISRSDLNPIEGQKTCLKGAETQAFAPLSPIQLELQQGIKRAFDPKGLFNPSRIYSEI